MYVYTHRKNTVHTEFGTICSFMHTLRVLGHTPHTQIRGITILMTGTSLTSGHPLPSPFPKQSMLFFPGLCTCSVIFHLPNIPFGLPTPGKNPTPLSECQFKYHLHWRSPLQIQLLFIPPLGSYSNCAQKAVTHGTSDTVILFKMSLWAHQQKWVLFCVFLRQYVIRCVMLNKCLLNPFKNKPRKWYKSFAVCRQSLATSGLRSPWKTSIRSIHFSSLAFLICGQRQWFLGCAWEILEVRSRIRYVCFFKSSWDDMDEQPGLEITRTFYTFHCYQFQQPSPSVTASRYSMLTSWYVYF